MQLVYLYLKAEYKTGFIRLISITGNFLKPYIPLALFAPAGHWD